MLSSSLCIINVNYFFSLVQYITSAEVFMVVTISLRVISAIGTSAFLTVIYSVVPVLYPGRFCRF